VLVCAHAGWCVSSRRSYSLTGSLDRLHRYYSMPKDYARMHGVLSTVWVMVRAVRMMAVIVRVIRSA